MKLRTKVESLVQLYELIPQEERIIVDVIRQVIKENFPGIQEKISYNVPFFYKQRSVCLVWPAAIKGGGVKEGVLLGFWYGNRLHDTEGFLDKGSNKQIFYKIFRKAEEIEEQPIIRILQEARRLDEGFAKKCKSK